MALGPVFGYLYQYRLIQKTKSVGSFSIDICGILLLANILRLNFFLFQRFETALVFQSVFMILMQVRSRPNRLLSCNCASNINQNASKLIWPWQTKLGPLLSKWGSLPSKGSPLWLLHIAKSSKRNISGDGRSLENMVSVV